LYSSIVDAQRDLLRRVEELQAVAAELASTDFLDDALARIVARAGSVLPAAGFLATVREHPEGTPLVVTEGIDRETAERAAAALWSGEVPPVALAAHGVAVAARMGGDDAPLGHLLALLAPGAEVGEVDERLLDAYASHAAATVRRTISAQHARQEHRAAQALLRLAHSLAGARSVPEVTGLVTEAVAEVSGCDVSGVWLLDREHDRYELQVVTEAGAAGAPHLLPVIDPDGPERMAADPSPFVLRPGDEPGVDEVLRAWDVGEAYVAPIVHRGRMYGLLSTAQQSSSAVGGQEAKLAAASALAHHAGTAIANVELLDQIRHQANHDALTGLPNRPQIEERTTAALRWAEARGTTVALAFVDLDRFKIVNDTLGHAAGDELIGRVAERIEAHLRPSDVVARLGGDEFLVLLTALEGPEQAEEVAARLLRALREPFEVHGESIFVTASVGIACFPQHGRDYDSLFRRADAAMYVAKGEGRNRVAVHRWPAGGPRSRLKLETELHQAIDRDELRLLYQPQVDLVTGEIIGAEALVRWQHPVLGLVGPSTFLSIAEESGVIVDVDGWVRREALTQAAAWCAAGTPVRVAVNVSRRDLADVGFATTIAALLDDLGLPPELVELEITDRIVMSDEELPPTVADVRALGVRLAVDDFGTGSSVLSRLHHCPVDVLKVDRLFVEPLSRPEPDTRLVDALVSMGHALGLEVVVEGVEDEHQAHAVRLLGAELGQGYHFHRPMPAEQLTVLLADGAGAGAPPGLRRREPRGTRR
jgi:diguanylate cyclase (GGDEF)-like protein